MNNLFSFLASKWFRYRPFLLPILNLAILSRSVAILSRRGLDRGMAVWLLLRSLKVSQVSEEVLSGAAAEPKTRRRRTKMAIV